MDRLHPNSRRRKHGFCISRPARRGRRPYQYLDRQTRVPKWRPITAINQGDFDGDPTTIGDVNGLALAEAYQDLTTFHQGRPPLFVP
jgi:hypothetical protein